MNANELADVLMSTKFQVDEDGVMIGVSHQAVDEAATMLRQQQAEIEALKAKCLDEITKRVYAERATEVVQELYTHPAKELTDEEIEKEAFKDKYWNYEDFDFMKFARAILRKAQEK